MDEKIAWTVLRNSGERKYSGCGFGWKIVAGAVYGVYVTIFPPPNVRHPHQYLYHSSIECKGDGNLQRSCNKPHIKKVV